MKDEEKLVTHEFEQEDVKFPKSIYFIIPNELTERFCFYGISPLLNHYFKDFLRFSDEDTSEYIHYFKSLAYFFPLVGALLSDSFLNKFNTIVLLSLVYLIGTVSLSVTSIPHLLSNVQIGPLISLLLIAIGTGGIKPCVSSHAGDQFKPEQQRALRSFYNYFYMAINVGSIGAGILVPWIKSGSCYNGSGDCYPQAFGICAGMMGVAIVVFSIGYKFYYISPAAGVFIPWELLKVGSFYLSKSKTTAYEQSCQKFGEELVVELLDISKVLLVLIPAPFFWMAFDQNGTSWQDLTDQMNNSLIGKSGSETLNSVTNPLLIILLSPLFAEVLYPFLDKLFPKKFRSLERMAVGMLLSGLAFIICAFYQRHVDAYCHGNSQCSSPDFPSLWMILPYVVITCGEILFSVSGLHFTYTEVGPKIKSSSAALWLLTVAIGNLLAAFLFKGTSNLARENFFWLVSGLCLAASVLQLILNRFYVYKEDRE